MEASVRFIMHDNDIGCKPALCFRGTKWAHCVVNEDTGIRVLEVPLRDFDQSPVVEHRGVPYSIERCAKTLFSFTTRTIARREITLGAQRLLEGVLDGTINEQVVEKAAVIAAPPPKSDSSDDAPTRTPTTLVATICNELKLEPTTARRLLRKAGLHAPYDDEAKIRSILTTK